MGQKPSALVRDLACEYKHELLLPVRALTLQSSQGPVLLPSSSSGAALTVSKRAEGATMPTAVISTFREGIWAIVHKSEQRELWFPPSAITPKLLLCHLTLRKENVAVSRGQLSEDKIQWYICSLYSDKGGNTTLPPKLYNMNISSFLYFKAPLISNYF